MKAALKKVSEWDYFPLLIYAAVIASFHFFMHENAILDAKRFFAPILDQMSFSEFVKECYETWASRIVVEGASVLTARHEILWRILDTGVYVLLAASLTKLLRSDHKRTVCFIACALILIYPFDDLASAGWLVTINAYIWPIAFGLYVLTAFSRIYHNEKIRVFEWPLLILAAIYTANMEQSCAILFAFALCFSIYIIRTRKKLPVFPLIILLITIASFIFIFTCPGNYARQEQELLEGITDFNMYTLTDKILLGFTNMAHRFLQNNLALITVSVILFALVTIRFKKVSYSVIASVPILFALRGGLSGLFAQEFSAALTSPQLFLSPTNHMLMADFIIPVLYAVFFVSLFLILAILSDSFLEWFTVSLVLFMGIASAMVMGFTPTVNNSVDRPLIFLMFSFLILGGYFLKKYLPMLEEKPMRSHLTLTVLGVAAVLGALQAYGSLAIHT